MNFRLQFLDRNLFVKDELFKRNQSSEFTVYSSLFRLFLIALLATSMMVAAFVHADEKDEFESDFWLGVATGMLLNYELEERARSYHILHESYSYNPRDGRQHKHKSKRHHHGHNHRHLKKRVRPMLYHQPRHWYEPPFDWYRVDHNFVEDCCSSGHF